MSNSVRCPGCGYALAPADVDTAAAQRNCPRCGAAMTVSGVGVSHARPDDPSVGPGALPYATSQRTSRRNVLISLGVLTGLALVLLLRIVFTQHGTPSAPATSPTTQQPSAEALAQLQVRVERQQRWQARVHPRLEVADEACAESIDKAVHVLTDFVAERKKGARPFAESILTFRSKWSLVVSHLPSWLGGDANSHRALLEKEFGDRVFTSDQMRQAVEAAVGTYLNHVQAIENQLLVDIRADLADLPLDAIPAGSSQEVFAKHFDRLVAEITPQVAGALGADVIREIGAWVGGELAARIAIRVLSSVATRLGVSAGILGAGASTSWATFGLSVLAAIVVDQAVGWIINWATDPVGKLEERVSQMLDEVCNLIVEGEGEGDGTLRGLRAELRVLDHARARVRSEALRKLVLGE